ncbi:MAG: 3-phosphoshikimate 1-carboxyvinyltransferase, partial [Muribaculaceae bacterium]|nr:3-phosphoshikimate 1-carboxyvinyltransferase [Muribaculaceae bacterium]
KETDRLMALKRELEKLGVSTEITSDSIRWDGKVSHIDRKVVIDTYKDHRMAMAFAPAAIKHDIITINDIEVVSKSYPDYWKDLSKFGFSYNL